MSAGTATTSRSCKIRGCVSPAAIHQPEQLPFLPVAFPRTWAITCGCCNRDIVVFSWNGKPKCPFCRTVNLPEFSDVGY